MEVDAETAFIAAGGNRHPSAADWDHGSGVVAFGAASNLALWKPDANSYRGVYALLKGHTGQVNAVKFLSDASEGRTILLSGGVDGAIRAWQSTNSTDFVEATNLKTGDKAINAIAVLFGSNVFVTSTASAELCLWQLQSNDGSVSIEPLQTLFIPGRSFALDVALHKLPDSNGLILAAAGTKPLVHLFVSDGIGHDFRHAASLSGHEGWIRSLSFIEDGADSNGSLLLASASQDKYIRLWRVRLEDGFSSTNGQSKEHLLGDTTSLLSNKAHQFKTGDFKYQVTFEALLLGHEDWILTARWTKDQGKLKLLSASADNSVAIWELDHQSGLWVCTVRLGELVSQKGATTATGSTGGFWIGLWSPDSKSVTSLGRTGSWRLWKQDPNSDNWSQEIGISGHTREVRDIAWAPNGSYLISTSADQTTRLFAEWLRHGVTSWHEFSRPQIHGYDLNCVDMVSGVQFVTGADEKLLRVFNQPKSVAQHLARLCGIEATQEGVMPDAANLSVLGLSNKAIDNSMPLASGEEQAEQNDEDVAASQTAAISKAVAGMKKPPLEDHLSRHLLWPEIEKLYGHGYEISAVAASHDGSVIATACRASSLDHAVIRLFETKMWHEVKPPLTAHSLTVTRLAFSTDDQYLLSVGRDRQCAIFQRSEANKQTYTQFAVDPKAHTRMILDCSWAPSADVFVSAGRDRCVRIWRVQPEGNLEQLNAIEEATPITAVSFAPCVIYGHYILACGLENGLVKILELTNDFKVEKQYQLSHKDCPSDTVSKLAWQSTSTRDDTAPTRLAIASLDSSVRIIDLKLGTGSTNGSS